MPGAGPSTGISALLDLKFWWEKLFLPSISAVRKGKAESLCSEGTCPRPGNLQTVEGKLKSSHFCSS